MVTITTEKELRDRQDPGFCYMCGVPWTPDTEKTADHVVPTNAFEIDDRKQPLILLAHKSCHAPKSEYDARVGQVFKLLHRTLPFNPKKYKLEFTKWTDKATGEEVGGVSEFEFHRIMVGWLKGFHAALYREYLPHDGERFAYTLPWASFIDDPNHVEPIQPVHIPWVETLVASRMAGKIDSIVAWNGKLRYVCTWDHLDNGRPLCLFALDIYDWTKLSPPGLGPKWSCTGSYHPAQVTPKMASRATRLAIPGRLRNPFDAFGSL